MTTITISPVYAFLSKYLPMTLLLATVGSVLFILREPPPKPAFFYGADEMPIANSPICTGDDTIIITVTGHAKPLPTWSAVELAAKIINLDTGTRAYVYPLVVWPEAPTSQNPAATSDFSFDLPRPVPTDLPPGRYLYVHMATNIYPDRRGTPQGFLAPFEVVPCID